MSRNFELMQQLEIVSSSSGRSIFEPDMSELDAIGVAIGTNRWAGDEASSIVQRILLPRKQDAPRMVVFAGVNHGDGCTAICASVAETLADSGCGQVCIVEANFRTPALSRRLGIANHNGLAEAIVREGPIRSFAKPTGTDGLWCISCGGNAMNWPNLLNSERLKPRLDELRKEFSFVIFDSPPLSRSADAVAIGQLADGVVMILEAASTRRESAQMATAALRSAKVPILGAVLNKRTFPIPERIYRRL
ncbi:MAG TPA: CpsD/CapB family tyrosine-protein kinase [Terracidiphilus sp.]|nr:CpsD/CapB family tyrosine-protein kinase [Terracidiphilus sp.]